jgi:HK97 family phage major capsid protein
MTTEHKTDELKEIHNAVSALGDALKRKDSQSAETKLCIEKIQADLDLHEKANKKLTCELEAKKTAEIEMKARLDTMESLHSRLPSGSNGVDADVEAKMQGFSKFLVKGKDFLNSEEIKYLRTDSDPQGGFLAPAEFVRQIIKPAFEISPMRSISTVRQTTLKEVELPREDALGEAYYQGEGTTVAESQEDYAMEIIKVNRISTKVLASLEMIQDAAFDVNAEIAANLAKRFEKREGRAFINGSGVTQPQGVMSNPDVDVINSSTLGSFSAQNLIALQGELAAEYQANATWILTSKTLSVIRSLALSAGADNLIWQPGIQAGFPSLILGRPYVLMPNVDEVADNSQPIAFGDFRRAYHIYDKTDDMMVLRNPFVNNGAGELIQFSANKRNGGKVVLADAVKKLQLSV